MLDRIEFLFGEALVALRRNGWMSFAAITTVAMAVFLLAGLVQVYTGIAKLTEGAGKRLTVRVFIRDTVPDAEASALGAQIKAMPGVSFVRFVPRRTGLEEFQKKNPEIDVTGLYEANPLPNCFHVSIADQQDFDSVVTSLKSMKEVEPNGVKFPSDVQEFLKELQSTVPVLGLTLGITMLVTSGILIYNAIRMTVVARRREVGIMLLVGAKRTMVWAPMVLEGLMQGSVGGILAGATLLTGHHFVRQVVQERMGNMATIPSMSVGTTLLVLGLVGAAYGTLCSVIAVREPWRQGVAA